MRHPTKPGEIWLHVDDPDTPDRRVWAVQYLEAGAVVYRTFRDVVILAYAQTVVFPGDQQPRMAVVCRGTVEVSGDLATIFPEVKTPLRPKR